MERAGVNGRRQTETREGAAGEGSGHEGERNASTIGEGASARSAEGEASASTSGKETGARSAEERASASTIGKRADARSAKPTKTILCRRIWRSSEKGPRLWFPVLPEHLLLLRKD